MTCGQAVPQGCPTANLTIMKKALLFLAVASLLAFAGCVTTDLTNPLLPEVSLSDMGYHGPVKSVSTNYVMTFSSDSSICYWLPDSTLKEFSTEGKCVNESFRRHYEAETEQYVYDSLGRLVADTLRSEGDNVMAYRYSSEGRLQSTESYFEFGDTWTMVRQTFFEYDAMGRPVLARDQHDTTRYYYDKRGRVVREETSKEVYSTFRYDRKGRVVERCNYFSNNWWTSTYRYDKHGNTIETSSIERVSESGMVLYNTSTNYTYTYFDKYGNWIKAQIIVKEKDARMGSNSEWHYDVNRVIEYY